MNPSKSFAWRLAALLAILGALALVAGCGDDDGGDGGDSGASETPAGSLPLEQAQAKLEDAGYSAEPLDEGELAEVGAVDGLRVVSEDGDGGFVGGYVGGYVYVFPEPVDEQAVATVFAHEPFELGEDGFVFNTYGPNGEENLQILVEAVSGG